ncbi:MAG TPA: hypothetical protein VMG10_34290 [Gemmataceae bacterium]|nr:hypothetical protein [Gemmataceae bacterium]
MNHFVLRAFLALSVVAHPVWVGAADVRAPKLFVREVAPSATDSHIDRFSGDGWEHSVYFHRLAAKKHQLVVFLPGTGGKGHGARAFCALAANAGFHVLCIAYPSTISMSVFRDSSDPDAFLKARENVIYGKAPFKKLRVNEANSIHNRVVKLLRYLAAKHPKENWGQYLGEKGSLQWGKLVLAGQSQGGGHAALLGMQHEAARVLMFGSPKDFNTHFRQPAKWYSGESATPRNRFFSFVHSADEGHGCTYVQQLDNYRAMKLLPRYKVIDVDKTRPPYRHSRLLTSNRPDENPHTLVINNKVYADVWKYLLEEPTK